jgi:hypothetical protein
MRKLWRTTSFLFWQYPVLWVPIIVADIAAFSLLRLQGLISHRIVLWIYQSHSVLSSAPDYRYDASEIREAVLLTAPLLWGSYFLSICFYTSAMLAISEALRQISRTHRIDLPGSASSLRPALPRALRFSLKLFVLCVGAAILLAAITTFLTKFGLVMEPRLFGYCYSLAFSSGIAYLVTPSALRILQSIGYTPISSERQRLGRIFAILALAASNTLGAMLAQVNLPLWEGWHAHAAAVRFVLSAIISLIAALPYIPLYIALYLIANPESPLNAIAETESPLPSPPQSPPEST